MFTLADSLRLWRRHRIDSRDQCLVAKMHLPMFFYNFFNKFLCLFILLDRALDENVSFLRHRYLLFRNLNSRTTFQLNLSNRFPALTYDQPHALIRYRDNISLMIELYVIRFLHEVKAAHRESIDGLEFGLDKTAHSSFERH